MVRHDQSSYNEINKNIKGDMEITEIERGIKKTGDVQKDRQ